METHPWQHTQQPDILWVQANILNKINNITNLLPTTSRDTPNRRRPGRDEVGLEGQGLGPVSWEERWEACYLGRPWTEAMAVVVAVVVVVDAVVEDAEVKKIVTVANLNV